MILKSMLKVSAISVVVMVGVMAPNHYSQGLSYKPAHGFIIKKAGGLAYNLAVKTIKRWLLYVSAKEGARVALSSLKAMGALHKDPLFRASVLAALAGESNAEAKTIALDVAKSSAKAQFKADKQSVINDKSLIIDDFKKFSGSTVEEGWNDVDDRLTCGKRNVNIEFQEGQGYRVVEDKNEELLEGRALMQRTFYTRMMANSTFTSDEEALAAAERYSNKACLLGKSGKIMALIGGFTVHKGQILASVEKPEKLFSDLTVWLDRRLNQ